MLCYSLILGNIPLYHPLYKQSLPQVLALLLHLARNCSDLPLYIGTLSSTQHALITLFNLAPRLRLILIFSRRGRSLNFLMDCSWWLVEEASLLQCSKYGITCNDFHVKYCSQNGEAEAIFTWTGANIAGSVHAGGMSWVLEGCGPGCFLWIQQKNNWLDETTAPNTRTKSGLFKHTGNVTKLLVPTPGGVK